MIDMFSVTLERIHLKGSFRSHDWEENHVALLPVLASWPSPSSHPVLGSQTVSSGQLIPSDVFHQELCSILLGQSKTVHNPRNSGTQHLTFALPWSSENEIFSQDHAHFLAQWSYFKYVYKRLAKVQLKRALEDTIFMGRFKRHRETWSM